MSLESKVMEAMKTAMKTKDSQALEALRAIKSAILLAKTGGSKEVSEAEEMTLLQKLVKQRRDSAAIYEQQNRSDLATPELAQIAVIETFLPKQLSEAEITDVIKEIISQSDASGIKDMGKVMGAASQKLAGRADGKTISGIVKKLLA
ncbi:MAG: GatB/YqeY domain-containing protein [Flavobacteriaceae bacterium]|nr:GatB/YqeY domain-containing protein [Flavobacteriaceae bacterium]